MNATEQHIKRYQTDLRFRAIAISAVHEAFREHGGITAAAFSDVHDVALRAVVIALGKAFDGDAELKAMQAERDQYKRLVEKLSGTFSALTIINRADAPPAKEKEA